MHFLGTFHNNQYLTSAGLYQLSDYPTFGSPMPTRQWSDPNSKYKYGFNGMEKDDDINVNGGSYDFGARIYDSRLGRWLSLDPMMYKFISLSPYSSFGNCPILVIDLEGEVLHIKNGDVILEYRDGKLYSMDEATGNFTIEYTPTSGEYAYKALSNILLLSNGEVGLKLVNDLEGSINVVTIQPLDEEHKTDRYSDNVIYTDFKGTRELPTQLDKKGRNQYTPAFVVLAHEMGHAISAVKGPDNGHWFTSYNVGYSQDEKYASHIENQVRAENGLALRTHYEEYNEETRLIDEEGNSIYYAKIISDFALKSVTVKDPNSNENVTGTFYYYGEVQTTYNYNTDKGAKNEKKTP